MKLIYVAGKFRGPHHYAIHKNVCRAEDIAWLIWAAGAVALCPHLNAAHFQDSLPDHIWLEGDLEMLRRSDAVMMVPGWQRSRGAKAERKEAIRHRIPVFTRLADLRRWLRNETTNHESTKTTRTRIPGRVPNNPKPHTRPKGLQRASRTLEDTGVSQVNVQDDSRGRR